MMTKTKKTLDCPAPPPPHLFLPPKTAAHALGISPSKLEKDRKARRGVPFLMVGGRYFYLNPIEFGELARGVRSGTPVVHDQGASS
jgi:hypothetical protein